MRHATQSLLRTASSQHSLSVEIGGQAYELGSGELREAIEQAGEETPVRVRALIYVQGWGDRPVQFSAETLSDLASTLPGCPVLYDHEGRDEGVVLSVEVVDASEHVTELSPQTPALLGVLDLYGDARRALSRGIRPRFSVGWLPVESTEAQCSACGGRLGTCSHRIGEDGVQILVAGGARGTEVSRTPKPSHLHTGLHPTLSAMEALMGEQLIAALRGAIDERAAATDEDASSVAARAAQDAGIEPAAMDQILSGEIDCPPVESLSALAGSLEVSETTLVEAAQSDGCQYSAPEEETEMAADDEGVRQLRARVAQGEQAILVAQLNAQLERMDARLEQQHAEIRTLRAERADRQASANLERVRQLHAEGRVRIPEGGSLQELSELRASDPDRFDRLWAYVPPDPGRVHGRLTGSAPSQPPGELSAIRSTHERIRERIREIPTELSASDKAAAIRRIRREEVTRLRTGGV